MYLNDTVLSQNNINMRFFVVEILSFNYLLLVLLLAVMSLMAQCISTLPSLMLVQNIRMLNWCQKQWVTRRLCRREKVCIYITKYGVCVLHINYRSTGYYNDVYISC